MSALADARQETLASGWIGLPTRRALEVQLGRRSKLGRPHTLVAVYAPCFLRVADRWRRHWPNDNSPFDLVRWSTDLVEGRGGSEYGLKAALGRVATLGDDLQGATEWDARVAWVAVGVARAALSGVGAADYADDDGALDLEDYDPPSLAACIEADGLPVAQSANDRHRPFWQWWLDSVVEPLLT